ncbi:CHAD domain-containing protein [Streptomyces formicae]|uniref:CHAD domain-containing protein n=1 Tax=Streptomyces formicae TaxID=1616117 RepID=A0ABY3WV57_9ACTN|nr:CHAD domain-containing protein [Streptomyces formicae]UNM15985.1 CHAD domain-containing protein [Streptomyces formicae]
MHSPDLPSVARGAGADQVLAEYLHTQAADFLRSLRVHGECGADTAGAKDAAGALRRAARRISGALHTYRPLLDTAWADQLRTELTWLSGVLAQEHACTARLNRLLDALSRLSGTGPVPPPRAEAELSVLTNPELLAAPSPGGHQAEATADAPAPAPHGGPEATAAGPRAAAAAAAAVAGQDVQAKGAAGGAATSGTRGALTVGAARAGALLERQLTLGRTRAHSAALQALGSSRFHAVADAVALLASEVPFAAAATAPADVLQGHAETAERRLLDAVAALPLARAAHPYNADALVHGLATTSAGEAQDAPWHHVRLLLRLHRYAQEVVCSGTHPLLTIAGRTLDRHRDAAEAAAAAASAARTPRIAPATAYALGVLHADQRHEVEAARFAFHRVWQSQAVPAP